MTDDQRELKLDSLKDKLDSLYERLFYAECEEYDKIVRNPKRYISTRKCDGIRKQIKICKRKIAELAN